MLQGEHSAILSTFIKLLFVIQICILSIFEWPLKTSFTVCDYVPLSHVLARALWCNSITRSLDSVTKWCFVVFSEIFSKNLATHETCIENTHNDVRVRNFALPRSVMGLSAVCDCGIS